MNDLIFSKELHKIAIDIEAVYGYPKTEELVFLFKLLSKSRLNYIIVFSDNGRERAEKLIRKLKITQFINKICDKNEVILANMSLIIDTNFLCKDVIKIN